MVSKKKGVATLRSMCILAFLLVYKKHGAPWLDSSPISRISLPGDQLISTACRGGTPRCRRSGRAWWRRSLAWAWPTRPSSPSSGPRRRRAGRWRRSWRGRSPCATPSSSTRPRRRSAWWSAHKEPIVRWSVCFRLILSHRTLISRLFTSRIYRSSPS